MLIYVESGIGFINKTTNKFLRKIASIRFSIKYYATLPIDYYTPGHFCEGFEHTRY